MIITLTVDTIKRCLPSAEIYNINKYVDHLNETIQKYDIDKPERCAAFLAQLAHESGSFRYVREIHDGSNYEGRKDLGNIFIGDGKKFRGRGLIQITGRTNYAALEKAFNIPFTEQPERLEEPQYATLSAGWFWDLRKLNHLADVGNFEMITRRINGGLNGYEDRKRLWENCKLVLYEY